MPNVWFGGRAVTIGAGTTINYGAFFDTSARITLGSNCSVGMQVMFCTGTHSIGDASKRAGESHSGPIRIGNGVWIGTRAVVLPNVTIGDGAVIGAGSVVTRDCDGHAVYAGNPARKVRSL